jgi:hypothetical protein
VEKKYKLQTKEELIFEYWQIGNQKFGWENFEEAIKFYDKVIQLDPKDPYVYIAKEMHLVI